MKVIVGLGNPGPQYGGTRHNVGSVIVEKLSRRWSLPLNEEFCRSRVGEGKVQGHSVRLVWPQTFMNGSGEAVGCLVERWKLDPSDLLVICDDVSLPIGMIRLRAQGSDAGHLGLASVLEKTGTDQIPRLRVGIRGVGVDADKAAYVLDRFEKSEQRFLEESLIAAVEACELWVNEGLATTMNRFNKKISESEK